MEINKEMLRWVLLIGAAPIWLPFLRTLWNDFNDALREEGGLFGTPPGPRQIEEIQREKAHKPETLISEPWVRRNERRAPRMGTRQAAAQPGARAPRFKSGPAPTTRTDAPQKRGFR
jgi:hypothetical protein